MKKLMVLFSLFCVLSLSGCGFEVVDTGDRGVKTTFGKVDMEAGSLPEGLYFYNPFVSSIIDMDTKVIKHDGGNETYTKDVQKATLKYVVNYHLDPTAAHIVYKEVGKDWEEKLVPQIVDGAIKNVIGQWEAVSLVENRGKATAAITEAIKVALADKHVLLDNFQLVNIDYSPEFEKAVEAKVTAIQRASEAENHTRQVSEEAKQRLIGAEADAKAMTIKSEALQKSQSLVAYEAVLKWDGKLPVYQLGGATPFINVSPQKE